MLAGCGGGAGGATSGAAAGTTVASGSLSAGATGASTRPRPRPLSADERLRLALGRTLAAAGAGAGVEVAPLTGAESLLALQAGIRRPPASVEKLYTTIAALELMGPGTRLRTEVLANGHRGRNGSWDGDLYLRGGGDPTFGEDTFHRLYEQGYGASIGTLARAVAAHGIRRVTGQIIGDDSLFDSARGGPSSKLAADIPDFGGQLSALTFDHGATQGLLSPGAFAAQELTRTLQRMGVAVRAAPGTARTPRSARLLAVVRSPPLSELVSLMNVPSDDLFAEMLTKQLGVRFGSAGTIAAGARVISGEIARLGLRPRIVDGSGLSRLNRSSPAEVVALLRDVWQTAAGRILAGSLPVVGETGTVRQIAPGTVAAGRCIAKTGTLDAVTNLAGYCRTLRGRNLAFAVFIDGPSNERALAILGRFVVTLVRRG